MQLGRSLDDIRITEDFAAAISEALNVASSGAADEAPGG